MSWRPLVVAFLWLAVLSMGLAEVYKFAGRWLSPSWFAAAIVNTILAGLGTWIYWRQRLSAAAIRARHSLHFMRRTGYAYAPAFSIVLLSLAAIAISRAVSPQAPHLLPLHPAQFAWIFWIPLIEELTFRIGFGSFFRRRAGTLWGAYFSAIFFALAHSQPTLANLMAGRWGLPIGPLLLGLACELLLVYSQRLGPLVALHAACNLTVVLFSAGDSRWLYWLDFLYL